MDSGAWTKGLGRETPESDRQHRPLFDALARLKEALEGGRGIASWCGPSIS